MESAHAGVNAYMILVQNNDNCPVRVPTYDTNEHLVNLNGIFYISIAYDFPYNSFANLVASVEEFVGWVFDDITGEGRYYDGTQADETEYWTPEQKAMGLISKFTPKNKRPVEEIKEIGSMYAVSLKSHQYSSEFAFEKIYIDKTKLSSPSRTSPVLNQYGFQGWEPVEVNQLQADGSIKDEFVATMKQNYFLAIIYIKDLSEDTANVARGMVFPCAKFENVSVEIESKKVISCSLDAKSTYWKSFPRSTIGEYEPSDPPIIDPEVCELFLTITSSNPTPLMHLGRDGSIQQPGDEFWTGNTFRLNESRVICQSDVYIEEPVGASPPDLISKIYLVTGGVPDNANLLGESDIILAGDVVAGWNGFTFSTPVNLSPGTQYALTFESTGPSTSGNGYVININTANPYGLGTYILSTHNAWANLPGSWSFDDESDLWSRLYALN